jgi:hypothetical protein
MSMTLLDAVTGINSYSSMLAILIYVRSAALRVHAFTRSEDPNLAFAALPPER